MKTFQQFSEDIETRREQLRQRQLSQIAAQRQRVADHQAAQKEKRDAEQERQQLKKEIKRELQTEQTPMMEPTSFNVMKSREQAKGGIAHRRHVHGELARIAAAQQKQKRAEMKAILSR